MLRQKISEYSKGILPLIILFVIAAVAECVFVFPTFTYDYISYDSSYQYALTQHSIPEIWELLPYDYSPPFYAITLKLFTMAFGNSLVVMRAYSLVAIIGMFFISAFPVRTLFGNWAAGICLAMTFCSTAMLDLTPEIRPTIFAMFFFMAASVYAILAYSEEKRYAYICMTVFAVLCLYTHNIAMLGMFSVYVVLLVVCLIRKEYKKFRNFLISGGICAVLYIPWLGVIIGQISAVKSHFWTSDISMFTSVKQMCTDIFISKTGFLQFLKLGLLAFGFFAVLLRHINLKKLKGAKSFREIVNIPAEKKDYFNILLLFLFLVAAVLMMAAVNLVVRNLNSHRYFAIIGTVWIVFLSAILGRLGSRICNIVLALILVICHFDNVNTILKGVDRASETNVVAEITEFSGDEKIAFLHTHEWSLGVMSYYFPNATHYVCDDMFTVLCTYDVFPVEVVDIGDYHDIWEYTDNCFVFSNEWPHSKTEEYITNEQIISEISTDDRIEYVGSYQMAYSLSCNSFEISHISAETPE